MDVELGLAAAERGEDGDGRELAVPQAEAVPRVDVAEGELDDVAPEVAQRTDDVLSRAAVDLGQAPGAALEALTAGGRSARARAPDVRSG